MKKIFKTILVTLSCAMLLGAPAMSVRASSLDDVVNENSAEAQVSTQESTTSSSSYTSADQFIASTQDAANLASADTAGADKVNNAIKKIVALIVKILSYALTAGLTLRVVLDLTYIALPFTRSALANGYGGNPQAGGAGMGMQQPGMGMGMGAGMGGMGMGMGGMGMRGGYGMNRMGMGAMGGMGAQGQMGASPAMGRWQLVSNQALNAVASESMPGPDGKPQSALKFYAKDMVVTLTVTPILLVLAMTGVLTNFGFLLGDVAARAVQGLGGMF